MYVIQHGRHASWDYILQTIFQNQFVGMCIPYLHIEVHIPS